MYIWQKINTNRLSNHFLNFWKGWFTITDLRFYNSYNWFITVVWYSTSVNMYSIHANLCIPSAAGYEHSNLILRFHLRVLHFAVTYFAYKATWDKITPYLFSFPMKNKTEMTNVPFPGLPRKYNFNSHEKKKRKIKYHLTIR